MPEEEPTGLTLEEAMEALTEGEIELSSGILANLTREAYAEPYDDYMNYQKWIPILSFNIITKAVQTISGVALLFTQDDLFAADDWIVCNQKPEL